MHCHPHPSPANRFRIGIWATAGAVVLASAATMLWFGQPQDDNPPSSIAPVAAAATTTASTHATVSDAPVWSAAPPRDPSLPGAAEALGAQRSFDSALPTSTY